MNLFFFQSILVEVISQRINFVPRFFKSIFESLVCFQDSYLELMKDNKNFTLSLLTFVSLYLFGILDRCNAASM